MVATNLEQGRRSLLRLEKLGGTLTHPLEKVRAA